MRYSADCPPEARQNGKELEQATTNALQVWLQPLRDLLPTRPITNTFRYRWLQDFREGEDDEKALREIDLRITFECKIGPSIAKTVGASPEVFMRQGTIVNPTLIGTLIHEVGHTFGMGDTYAVEWIASTGGLSTTAGKQPASMMAAYFNNPPLGEDDKRGIVWLYKHVYEGLRLDDCFFSDYVFEEETRGCRPKHPLIFEAKYANNLHIVLQILDDDPSLNVNARDAEGFTALHYAVIREHTEVVERLLAHEDIKPFLRDKRGHTALRLAQAAELSDIALLLRKHPLTSRIDFTQTLATTWGNLKIEQ